MTMTETDLDDDDRRPRRHVLKGWERRQAEREEATRELLSVFEQQVASLGGILNTLRSPPVNDVLFSGAVTIPAVGFAELQWPQQHASLSLANLSAGLLIVGGSAGTEPNVGAGVQRIPPGIFRTWPARGQGIRVWGLPGSTFDLAVHIRPREPASGPCSRAVGGILVPPGTTAAGVATQSVPFSGANLGHIVVDLNVSAISGGEGIAPQLYGVTPSGYQYPLFTTPATITTVGQTQLRVGPGFTPASGATANDLVPERLLLVLTMSGAGSVAYGVDLVAGQ